MRKLLLLPLLIVTFSGFAQQGPAPEKWDLRKCVEYAWEHNISVRQSDIQARVANLTYEQSKLSRYPNANFTNSTGTNFGRAINPATNLFESSTLLFQQYNLSVNAQIFNFGNVKNQILANQYNYQAAKEDVQRNKNDIGLTVATTYLQVLLAKEQARIAAAQMELTRARLLDTRKRVDAGTLPELNALELEAQYARDSSSFIAAVTTAEQNLLNLKATLNLDAAVVFDIVEPPVNMIPVDPISELQPDYVYQMALQSQPQIKVNDLRMKALQYNLKASKAALYPSIAAFGGLGTNFANPNTQTSATFAGYASSPVFPPLVNVNGTNYPLQTPQFNFIQGKKGFGDMWTGWGTQINENFRQNIGIQISVPIFNGSNARTAYKRVQLDIKNNELLKEQAAQTLKNNIYQAYVAASNALQRYNASKKTLEISERTYNLAQKRYDAGLLSTIDLITNQNNLFRARIQAIADQYDYVFRMKVLEFYKGQGLRL
ncbi:MAG: TolC family protein [Chitinophagaceae bacterium]|jgi:outer membrane protein|nr:TolC family protein [Chitinophagaceae bacterium]